jgi:hypothetical protein
MAKRIPNVCTERVPVNSRAPSNEVIAQQTATSSPGRGGDLEEPTASAVYEQAVAGAVSHPAGPVHPRERAAPLHRAGGRRSVAGAPTGLPEPGWGLTTIGTVARSLDPRRP